MNKTIITLIALTIALGQEATFGQTNAPVQTKVPLQTNTPAQAKAPTQTTAPTQKNAPVKRLRFGQTKAQPSETPRFFFKGLLIGDTTIPGEQKKDNVTPNNATCWRLSKNRYIWTFTTIGTQGTDAQRAIGYQIRKDTPDGPILKEGLLLPYHDNKWDPLNRGDKYFRQSGHCKVFGVPKGAVDKNGKLLPSQNVFCATWYQLAQPVDTKGNVMAAPDYKLFDATMRIAGVQFRLNEAEDNIEMLTPVTVRRQNGYESGDAFCELGATVKTVNQWYVACVPYNEECTQWADVCHFSHETDSGKFAIAPVLMGFNPKTGLYEWVKTGPLTKGEKNLSECSLSKAGDDWIVGVRGGLWFKTKDLFGDLGKPFQSPGNMAEANRSSYYCPDGVLRVFGGSRVLSAFKWVRDPQYCWDVAMNTTNNTCTFSNCKTVLSSDDIGMTPSPVMRCFLTPVFNNKQIVSISAFKMGKSALPEMKITGVYYAYVTYDKDIKEEWQFEAGG